MRTGDRIRVGEAIGNFNFCMRTGHSVLLMLYSKTGHSLANTTVPTSISLLPNKFGKKDKREIFLTLSANKIRFDWFIRMYNKFEK
jgi:hypothetical protein